MRHPVARRAAAPAAPRCCAGRDLDPPRRPPSRRAVLASTVGAALIARPTHASKLGSQVDAVWQNITGAPPDLYFPGGVFGGGFIAESTLISADAPRGEDALPPASAAALARARENDLGRAIVYRARFVRAPGPAGDRGAVILDRAYNTANLLAATPGGAAPDAVDWNPADPNDLAMRFGRGGLTARVRVTRRSQTDGATPASTETSEFSQITLAAGDAPPRVKASRVFTKWKWRGVEDAGGGPTIVATQVVDEFLTPFDGGGGGAPGDAVFGSGAVVRYTYRLALTPEREGGERREE